MKIEGNNIIFEKVDLQKMFTEELTASFLGCKRILDEKNILLVDRKLIIPLDGSLWYGMRIETRVVSNG